MEVYRARSNWQWKIRNALKGREGTWNWNEETAESERVFAQSNKQDEEAFECITSGFANFYAPMQQ